MPLELLFHPFRPRIEECFARARADGGVSVAAVTLTIENEPRGLGRARAEFTVIDPRGPVRVTWNGIASLWALAQGAARLSRRMYGGRRENAQQLAIDGDPELERGLHSLELARRLCTASLDHWPTWAPQISVSPALDTDDDVGNRFFLGALSWMFRHELAHVACDHAARQVPEGLTTRECEGEADVQATRWFRGSFQADPNRLTGDLPGASEL